MNDEGGTNNGVNKGGGSKGRDVPLRQQEFVQMTRVRVHDAAESVGHWVEPNVNGETLSISKNFALWMTHTLSTGSPFVRSCNLSSLEEMVLTVCDEHSGIHQIICIFLEPWRCSLQHCELACDVFVSSSRACSPQPPLVHLGLATVAHHVRPGGSMFVDLRCMLCTNSH